MMQMCSRIVVVLSVVLAVSAAFARESVFFIGAHPDDLECCLGLMLRMKDRYDIQMIDFTRGEGGLGKAGYLDGTTAVKRVAEEREVAKTFGCEPIFLTQVNYRGRAYAEPYVTAEIEKLLVERKPRAVFVNWPVDGHPDHVQCAAATLHAVYNVKRDHKLTTEVYFYEEPPDEGQNFTPKAYYVDVTEQMDEAYALCCKWACQNGARIGTRKRARLAKHGANAPQPVSFAEVYTTFTGEPMPDGVLAEFAVSPEMKPVEWKSEMGRLCL